MGKKIFNSRMVQKHDTEANWLLSNFIPMKGELAVYDIDDTYNYERFKIGDGKTVVSSLPFITDGLEAYINSLSDLIGDTTVSEQIADAFDDAITGLTVDGTGITYTKGDGSNGTITVQGANHAATADIANAVSFQALEANTDLDDIITPGFYGARTATVGQTLLNNPLSSLVTGVYLEVYSIDGLPCQVVTGVLYGGVYKRRYSTSSKSWSPWIQMATVDDNVASATKASKDGANNLITSTYTRGYMIDTIDNYVNFQIVGDGKDLTLRVQRAPVTIYARGQSGESIQIDFTASTKDGSPIGNVLYYSGHMSASSASYTTSGNTTTYTIYFNRSGLYAGANVFIPGQCCLTIANSGTTVTDGTVITCSSTTSLAAYPAGALYFSSSATSPAELLGGTWEIVKDTLIAAAGDTYGSLSTGQLSYVSSGASSNVKYTAYNVWRRIS